MLKRRLYLVIAVLGLSSSALGQEVTSTQSIQSPFQPAQESSSNRRPLRILENANLLGTFGTVYLDGAPNPFTATGIMLEAVSTRPFIVARTGRSDTGSGFLVYNSVNNPLFHVQSDGKVAIGQPVIFTPQDFLHVGYNHNDLTAIRVSNADVGQYSAAGIRFGNGTTDRAGIWSLGPASGAVGGPNALQVWNSANGVVVIGTNNAERLRVDAGGNIGIGTPAPSSKLHVVGNSTFVGNATFTGTVTGGNIQAKYQDVAEWVPSADDLFPGTVVVLNPAKSNEVRASTSAYDTTVAGVVSAAPGLILGERSDGKEMIATTGRVKVKVDATRLPIHVGDLLVTSDRSGMAMRSAPIDVSGIPIHRPGTIIGKALEPLEHGEGEILVLLSLQ